MGALFLACKMEECARKIRDIVNVFYYLQFHSNSSSRTSSSFQKQVKNGETVESSIPKQTKSNYKPMEYSGREFYLLKDAMIDGELLILTHLGFNVRVQHPYGYLINYLQALDLNENKLISQCAWNYLNDSLRSNISVCYQPSDIACAVIYKAAKDLKIYLPVSDYPWWEVFGAFELDLKNISGALDELYEMDVSLDNLNQNNIMLNLC